MDVGDGHAADVRELGGNAKLLGLVGVGDRDAVDAQSREALDEPLGGVHAERGRNRDVQSVELQRAELDGEGLDGSLVAGLVAGVSTTTMPFWRPLWTAALASCAVGATVTQVLWPFSRSLTSAPQSSPPSATTLAASVLARA